VVEEVGGVRPNAEEQKVHRGADRPNHRSTGSDFVSSLARRWSGGDGTGSGAVWVHVIDAPGCRIENRGILQH
jgi:hypothetical protein